jgi:CRP/FNR family transcriptional regulator, cyclic AMP receptor protein
MEYRSESEAKADIKRLAAACMQNDSETALGQYIKLTHWELLSSYMQPMTLAQSQVLITKGSNDRTVYFVEEGSLTVHYADSAGRVRLAIVAPGSAVGEGSFFSHLPRNATVQAAGATRVWGLTPIRFSELSNRQPAVAVVVAMALGALVSSRVVDRRKRISVT